MEKAMIARYRSAEAASPALAATLTPLLHQHQAHLAALRARLRSRRRPGRPGNRHPGTGHPAALWTGAVWLGTPAQPTAPATALTTLAADEDAAAATLTGLLAAVGPSLAQLLASVAASEASHAVLLRARRSSR